MFASNFPQKNTFFLNDELLKCSFLFRYSELKLNMLSVFSSLSIKSGVIWFWCFLSRRAEIFCPLFFDAGGVSWIIVKLFHKKLSPVGAVEYFKLRLLTKTFEGFFLFEFTLQKCWILQSFSTIIIVLYCIRKLLLLILQNILKKSNKGILNFMVTN